MYTSTDVASHFVDHPQTQLVGLADTKPVVPELKPGAPYTREWNIRYVSDLCGAPIYEDWRAMLDTLRPDLCVVNSENSYHVEITQFCAERGIGVCIEKPWLTIWPTDSEWPVLPKCITAS